MADVKIVDIDNVQWNMKDQEARNRIAILETEIQKLKTVEKWEYNIPIYGGEIVARKQGNVVNVTGVNIGTSKGLPTDIGDIDLAVLPERFRPSTINFFMVRTSGSYITQIGGAVYPNGAINYYTYELTNFGYFSVSYIVD